MPPNTPKNNSNSDPEKMELIHYRVKSYSGRRLLTLPNYEPEVKKLLGLKWKIDFLDVPDYSYEVFTLLETRWAQFAREWWTVNFKKVLVKRMLRDNS